MNQLPSLKACSHAFRSYCWVWLTCHLQSLNQETFRLIKLSSCFFLLIYSYFGACFLSLSLSEWHGLWPFYFWQPPVFCRDCQSFRVYSMLQCQCLCERCDHHTVTLTLTEPSFPPLIYSFWTKKHTVETFPLYGSWLAFADFYNELSIIVINIVISSIIEYLLHSTQSYMMCSATTLVWKHL